MAREQWGPLLKKQVVEKTEVYSTQDGPKKVNILIFRNLRVLKREPTRKRKQELIIEKMKGYYRDVPIIEDEKTEIFIKVIKDYIKTLDDDEPLFNISRQRALEILHKYGIYCHYLRHQKASDLVRNNNYNPFELQQFIGWKTGEMTKKYTHLNIRDLIKKQIETAKWK